MRYDPQSPSHRADLASALEALMGRSLFMQVEIKGTREAVFARDMPNTEGRIRVMVYSTIEDGAVRKAGKDAIRVAAVYKARDGRLRGLAAGSTRINRTGTIDAITDRVLDRMRGCWKAVKADTDRCHCGAPKFKTKKGRLVCADLCWLKGRPVRHSLRVGVGVGL